MRFCFSIFTVFLLSLLLAISSNAEAKTKSKKLRKPASTKKSKSVRTFPKFCRLMNNSFNLYTAPAHELASLAQWRSEMLTADPVTSRGRTRKETLVKECLNTCPEPSFEMQQFCSGLDDCQKHCYTSKVIQNSNCTNSSTCVQMGCSPMPPRIDIKQWTKRDELVRSKVFIIMANRIVSEFLTTNVDSLAYDLSDAYKTHFDFAKNFLMYRPNRTESFARYLPQTMRCLNNVENNVLEPVMQNNSFTTGLVCGHAFGLGQVIPETFYSIFGIQASGVLSVQPLKNPCKIGLNEYPIKDLPRLCSSTRFQSQFYRIEIFKKYEHLTPQQIHDLRAFDTELQIRLMLAVIVNKIIETKNWNSAFTSYGSPSYANYTGQNSCVQTNTINGINTRAAEIQKNGSK